METKESGIVYNAPAVRSWKDEGHFIIPEVVYREKTGVYVRTYRLFEKMTPAMNQEQLAELYEQEKAKGNPHPTDRPLIEAVVTKAHELIDQNPKEAKRLRNFLQAGFQKYPNTLTRIIYNPSGKDKIVHNHGTSDEYSLDGKVVGPDGEINEIRDKIVLKKLLGTSNIKQINKVSQWINKTNTYFYRLNSKPEQKDERIVRFGADVDRFFLDCSGGLPYFGPAFRVLKVD